MIDHHKLIDVLSERLKIEVKTASHGLHEILEQLHRSLQEVGEAELPGLGTFRLDGNQLSFDPEPALVMDINVRYHGLQPIIVEVARHETAQMDAEDDEIPETAVFVINEPEVAEVPIDAGEKAEDVESDSDQDIVEMEEAAPAPVSTDVPKVVDLKTPPLKWRDPHTLPVEIRIDDNYIHKGERWRKIAGIVAFTLLLLAGAGASWYKGWLADTGIPTFHEVFPDYVTRNDPGSITLDSPTIEENRGTGIGEQEQEQLQLQEQEQEQGQEQVQGQEQGLSVEVQEPQVDTDGGGTYGITGTWQQDTPRYFTIVSATMFTERIANQVFEEVAAANTRARLFRVRVQGEVAWELHVGQFETREQAREANLTLDRKFQSDVVRQYGQQ